MKIDVSKSPLENVVGLVVEVNPGKTLTAAQVTAGAPSVIDTGLGRGNTDLLLTAVVGQGKAGSFTFSYTRLALDKGVAVAPTSVQVVDGDDQAASFAKVITALGLKASDVTSSAYTAPVDTETDGTITVSAVADSLLYVGADLVITLTFADPQLDEEFTVKTANGFEPA